MTKIEAIAPHASVLPSGGREVRAVVTLIIVTAAIRVAMGWALSLGIDESYMVAAGRTLRLGYFDHPPASWWLAWSAAALTGSDAALIVRLPFIALFAISTWLMFRIGTAVAGARAGLWAAVLLNLSPEFGITAGGWVLPDGPLLCALLGAALCLIHALPAHGRAAWRWWLGAGLCAGLALFSKYSAVLSIAGAFVYLLTQPAHRRWLGRPQPYAAAALALLVFAPVPLWNATHGWASFAFQGERAAAAGFHPLAPLIVLAGEALFVLPWIWLPMMVAFVVALRRGTADWRAWLLCCLGAPPIVAFALIAAWSNDRVLFHWAAPGYLMLFPLLGDLVARRLAAGDRHARRLLAGTAILVCLVLAVVATQVRLDWLHPVIARVWPQRDPDVEGIDWTSLRATLRARGWLDRPGLIVGATDWRDAGKIAYALGPDIPVVILSRDARQFGFDAPAGGFIGRDMLLVVPASSAREVAPLTSVFASIEPLPPTAIRGAGHDVQEVLLYDARRLLRWPPP